MMVRRARPEDAKSIAAIHVHSWQEAYKGIVHKSYLDSLSIQAREKVRQENLKQEKSDTWVAQEGGQVLGWITAAQSRDSDARSSTGEVHVGTQHGINALGLEN
jgi:L-amino acid N-acyltransferase YncA